MIAGTGTDIASVKRIQDILQRRGEKFLLKLLSPAETESGFTADAGRLAGRWAAKEAVAKALGTGIGARCSLNEISIDSRNGRPEVTLTGKAEKFFRESGGGHIHLSISHEQESAIAFAVWEKTAAFQN